MTQEKQDQVREQTADGIQEFDNPMPRWWVNLFYLTIVLGVAYGVYKYPFGGESLIEAYDKGVAANKEMAESVTAASSTESSPSSASAVPLAERLKSADYIAAGKGVYDANCAPCHGPDGGGVIGPNLTDNFFIHGNSPEAVVKIISDGAPTKGMIGWKAVIGPEKVDQAAAYVMSLVGTTPANPKEAQGEEAK